MLEIKGIVLKRENWIIKHILFVRITFLTDVG